MIQLIDITDEHRYYELGYWPTIEAANAAINDCLIKDDAPPSGACTDEEFGVKLELRQVPSGWGDCKTLQTREWRSEYSEERDEYYFVEVAA